MSTRLQVVVDEVELRRFQKVAEVRGLTLSEWVRQTLREAARDTSFGDVEAKLASIRRAVKINGPIADIDQMLEEIARGREDPSLP